jgi:hypothetical protein
MAVIVRHFFVFKFELQRDQTFKFKYIFNVQKATTALAADAGGSW